MTREEYMKALKSNIQSLTVDEQEEALQYYADYFDEAGDDEKVMKELGTPEEVASSIIEKFANALVETDKKNKKADDEDKTDSKKSDAESSYSDGRSDAMYFQFNESEVKGIEFQFGAADVVLVSGDKYSVETRGVMRDNFLCRIDSEGTLVVKNLKKLNVLNFWNHEKVTRIVPRILITVPEKASVNKCKILIGAGNFRTKDVFIECQKGSFEVEAGSLVLKNVHGNNVNIRCGMGNIKVEGVLTGRSDIDCGMGSIKLDLQGDVKEYSCDVKVGLGEIKLNDEKYSGVCQKFADVKKDNHFSVNCGMGSVNIALHRF